MILGIVGDAVLWLCCVIAFIVCTRRYRELCVLIVFSALGYCACLQQKPLPTHVSGVVSVSSGELMHLIEDSGKRRKVIASSPVSAGCYISAQVKECSIGLVPGRMKQRFLRLVKYDKIEPAGVSRRGEVYDACYERMSPDAASVISALTVGVSNMSAELRAVFANSGLSHLLAISGLHVGLVCGGSWFLMRRVMALLFFENMEFAAMIISLVIGFLYTMLAGCGVSLIRARMMFTLAAIARSFNRFSDYKRLWGLTACLILWNSPEEWHAPGFVLSFAATAALLVEHKLLHLITAPYVAYFFFQIPLGSFAANIIAIPWTTFVLMPVVIVNFILWCIGINGFFAITELCASVLIAMSHVFACVPVLRVPLQPAYAIALYSWCAFMFFAYNREGLRYLGFGLICFAVSALLAPRGQIAMKAGSQFGLWDGEVLWVSDNCSLASHRWSQALGGVCIKQITSNDNLLDTLDGVLWKGHERRVWWGRHAVLKSVAKHAQVRLWKKKPRCLEYKIAECIDTDEDAWVWLDSGEVYVI